MRCLLLATLSISMVYARTLGAARRGLRPAAAFLARAPLRGGAAASPPRSSLSMSSLPPSLATLDPAANPGYALSPDAGLGGVGGWLQHRADAAAPASGPGDDWVGEVRRRCPYGATIRGSTTGGVSSVLASTRPPPTAPACEGRAPVIRVRL